MSRGPQRSGFDPTRRNRNIGTVKRGHGQDNCFVVPESWHDRRTLYEKLHDPVVVHRQIDGGDYVFLVEPPRQDRIHCCTVDDAAHLISLLPAADRHRVRTFVFRQPTRKEDRFGAYWGRMIYWGDLGKYSGVVVYLEAQNPAVPLIQSRSQDPAGLKELERLRQDGHEVVRTRRQFEIRSTLETIRNTQLYRTLPHEIGHYVHYLQALERGIDHWSRPHLEREDYAHRYADEFRARARRLGWIPFERRLNQHRLSRDGLHPKWFGV